MPSHTQLDLRALTMTAAPRSTLRKFRNDLKAGHFGKIPYLPDFYERQDIVKLIVTAAVTLVASILVFIFASGAQSADGRTFFIAIGVLFILFEIVTAVRLVKTPSTWQKWYRLAVLARSNGWRTQPVAQHPEYPGVIFDVGRGKLITERVFRPGENMFDIAHYTYSTGGARNETTYSWTYVALKLDKALPHIVLDGVANNSTFGSNLPATINRSQVLELEGDFNHHFKLYCPEGSERDALYIFTPDLMALLIDNAGSFDVEIVDDWLFLYSSRTLDFTAPSTWQRLMGIIDTVGAKTLARAAQYRGDSAGTSVLPTAAPPAVASHDAPPHEARAPSSQDQPAAEDRLRKRKHVPGFVYTVIGMVVTLAVILGIGFLTG